MAKLKAMIGATPFSVTARMKEQFFDRKKVINETNKKTRRSLSRFGYYVMSDARRSMRKGTFRKVGKPTRDTAGRFVATDRPRVKVHSRAGSPPRVWEGLVKRLTLFAYDPYRMSVVIGTIGDSRPRSAPRLLEYGGRIPYNFITAQGYRVRGVGYMEPRPYLRPAFDRNLPKFKKLMEG